MISSSPAEPPLVLSFFSLLTSPLPLPHCAMQNRRPDYIASYFNLVNWDKVAARYEAAL